VSWTRRAERVQDTQRAGEEFAAVLEPGDVVLLTGQLGAGKTAFVQGLGAGLGVRERVTSPTFTVVRQHRCHARATITTLHHADVYRTRDVTEIVDLALGELVEENAVAVVEWGEMATSVFGDDVITVSLDVEPDESRVITVAGAAATVRARRLDLWERP